MKRGDEQDDYIMRQVRAITEVDAALVTRVNVATLVEWVRGSATGWDPAELLRAAAALFREHAITLVATGRAGEAEAFLRRAAELGGVAATSADPPA